MSSDLKEFEKRLQELEKKVNNGSSEKEKKEKKPRKPSEYNKFVQDYISSERKKSSTKSHRELFAEAAKAWTSKKT
jgi:hypothetical protein